MSTDAADCEAFTCLHPTVPLTNDNSMLVRIVDRSTSMGTTIVTERLSEQVNRIHKTCFNTREYRKA